MSVQLPAPVFGLSLHPSRHILAAGSLDGNLACVDYASGPCGVLFDLRIATQSLRAVEFSPDAALIYAVSADTSIAHVDASTGTALLTIPNAHRSPINALAPISHHLYATGDDDGCIKIWDSRLPPSCPAHTWLAHKEYIAQLHYMESKHLLFSAGGDGILTLYDPRKALHAIHQGKPSVAQPYAMSDSIDDEFLCILPHRHNTKLLLGTESGCISVFEWDHWAAPNDSIPGHPASVNHMLHIDDATILTAAADGLVRVVQTFPHKVLGIVPVGDEDDDHADNLLDPIEGMRLSHDQKWLVIAQDDRVKVVDVEYLFDDQDDDHDEGVQNENKHATLTGQTTKSISSNKQIAVHPSDKDCDGGGDDDEWTSEDDINTDSKLLLPPPPPQQQLQYQTSKKRPASESSSTQVVNKPDNEAPDSSDSDNNQKSNGRTPKLTTRQKRRLKTTGTVEVTGPIIDFFAGID
ncbi:hypothetical protein SeLEV6574_g01313 [Synchytrium endobioticum]|uniref:WD repeat-containing protein JIP5 n=1 Tax=Synchytrium endobioticum TaxID=286115 RepID=A0A507DDJ6_9FUNG|nr:hypothetical protein SeLEV6574_g01313 [Synchytrium endobioticum]